MEIVSAILEELSQPYRWWGIVGLVFVIIGLTYHCTKRGCGLVSERRRRSALYAIGGICLFVYSLILADPVFALLQIAFTTAAAWELARTYRKANA